MNEIQVDRLTPPDEFSFPFVPYPIQSDFMKQLYIALEDGKLGIFESPTGTGKSQSLICGSLRWLLDHEEREKRSLAEKIAKLSIIDNDSSCDWISAQAKNLEKEHTKYQLKLILDKILEKEERLKLLKKKVKEKKLNERKVSKPVNKPEETNETNEENNDLLEENLIDTTDDENDVDEEEPESDVKQDVKIIISSRTHSQLSQLVNEVKRGPYSDSVRLITLASRNNYCINPSVRKLNSLSLINERCIDLQRNKKEKVTLQNENGCKIKKSRCGGSGGCSYLSTASDLKDETLTSVMDVEDIVSRGKQINACPYYATRSAVEDAQVVVVPYNILLHKSTREACGLNVKNSVVIIDEAHNLLDTIQHIHSAEVTINLLKNAQSQLTAYRDKYKTRFSAFNLLNLNQIIYIVDNLIKIISSKDLNRPPSTVMLINDFVFKANIDNLNIYKLLIFCKNSKLSQKLQGFVLKRNPEDERKIIKAETGVSAFLKQIQSNNLSNNAQLNNKKSDVSEPNEEKPNEKETLPTNSLPNLLSFLECLTNPSDDGRIICTYNNADNSGGSIKCLVLNPSSHFKDIVLEARSVIVAGGTMQPVTEFSHQLFKAAGASLDRILHFSCGHVIPPSHILPIALTTGPTNKTLDFSYNSKDSTDMLDEIGRILLNITNVVPAGIVCFFTSYNYEQTVYQHLNKSGIHSKISSKKKIFREPKESNQVDKVLQDYAKAIKSSSSTGSKLNGALLFSVVGGKLSEGLNFSDDLGRCVILVGLPYPNIKSAELQEKMTYLSSLLGGRAGDEHYENLCMKAVNQTIGRAVRHKNDYATIWLIDKRYARTSTQNQLPKWISTSLKTCNQFGQAMGMTARFFSTMSKK